VTFAVKVARKDKKFSRTNRRSGRVKDVDYKIFG